MAMPDMLREAGWTLVDNIDLSADYLLATRRHVRGQEAHAREIAEAFGADEASEMLNRRRATVAALEDELLRRALFEAVPAKG